MFPLLTPGSSEILPIPKIPISGGLIIGLKKSTSDALRLVKEKDDSDISSTVKQIIELENAGADIVRVSCPDENSTSSLKDIVKEVKVPIVADIHFHYKRALEAAKAGASCLRINPGNIGSSDRVLDIIKAAKDYNCSIRIGVNAGSLDKSLLEK